MIHPIRINPNTGEVYNLNKLIPSPIRIPITGLSPDNYVPGMYYEITISSGPTRNIIKVK